MSSRAPTLLQIIPRLDTGGAELSTVEITQAVVQAGGRMLVATEGGRLAQAIRENGGDIVPFPAGTKTPWRIWRNGRALAELITREGVALIHARSRAPAWSALMAARRTGIPFVTTYHGAYAEKSALKRLYNSVMARSDIVIANSGYTASLIRDRYQTEPEKIRVIPRGVDLTRFAPDAVAPDRVFKLREAWGVPASRPIILQAARLTGWKGQSVLIAAVQRLAARGHLGDAIVVLAGDSQGRSGYTEKLTSEIEHAGLRDRFRLVGHVHDMPAAYAAAYVTVVASTEPEAFGRAAAEAEAMGCPVISTNIGAPPETILAPPVVAAADATGWLVPPSDPDAMAQAIATALQLSGADRAAMGRRAVAFVNQRFTAHAMQSATLAVYDELLGTSLQRVFNQRSTATADGKPERFP